MHDQETEPRWILAARSPAFLSDSAEGIKKFLFSNKALQESSGGENEGINYLIVFIGIIALLGDLLFALPKKKP